MPVASPIGANTSMSSFVSSTAMPAQGLANTNGTATTAFSQSAPATTQTSPTTAPHPQTSNNGASEHGAIDNGTRCNETSSNLSLDTSFFHGTPTSSNTQNLYIQVATGGGAGRASGGTESATSPTTSSNGQGDFWVTCPWPSTIKKMVEHPNLVYTLLNQLRAHPTMKSKALQILTGGGDNGDSGMGVGDFNLPPSPTMAANAQNLSLFSPHGNDSPGMWSSGNEFGTSAQSFRAGPGTPMTSNFPDSGQSSAGSPASVNANYSSPWSMSGGHFDSLSLAAIPSNYGGIMPSAGGLSGSGAATVAVGAGGGFGSAYPSVVTATADTIDPNILTQVESNLNMEEYIWSPADTSLYEVGNARAIQAMALPGAIKMVFPPNTMIMAWEKDGSLASPAFRPLHPHSNQWLKAQVCDRRCAYRAGTSSLKRPITIRDHFRKCVYLDENHPLKVLCSLELAAHERASQGLLPNRRRTRGARLGIKSSADPPSPMVTRAPRPFPATRSSSISTISAAHVKSELGSPYSGPGSGNEADNDRGGDTSAMSSRDESMHRANESDGDFSMDKAPRSLRGITSIADPSASIPSGLATESSGTSSAYASPYPGHQHFGQPRENDQQHYSHPASYMMHSRRHTVPDASRNVFPSGTMSTMSGVESNSMEYQPFRQNTMFGTGHDVQSQYGGLFYSAASSSMVGPHSPDSRALQNFPARVAAGAAPVRKQLQPQSFTAPTTPSTATAFSMKGQQDSSQSAISFLDSLSSPAVSSPARPLREPASIDPRGLLAFSSSPYTSSTSSISRTDDNTFSPFSSTVSSPNLRDATLFDGGPSPLEMKPDPEPFNQKSGTNRFFGTHHSQTMHDDSDSAFTTDFSSSEDEAFSTR